MRFLDFLKQSTKKPELNTTNPKQLPQESDIQINKPYSPACQNEYFIFDMRIKPSMFPAPNNYHVLNQNEIAFFISCVMN